MDIYQLEHTGLHTVFSRQIGENKYRHYSMSVASQYTSTESPEELLREKLAEEGITSFTVIPPVSTRNLQLANISNIVLKNEPRLRWALKKKISKSIMATRQVPLQSLSNFKKMIFWSELILYKWGLRKKIKTPFVQVLDLVHYLSIACHESKVELAAKSLKEDLKILHKHGLIQGHLIMPSATRLTNTVGPGHGKMVVFAFPLINHDKLKKIIGNKANGRNKHTLLKDLGVKYETVEGELKDFEKTDPPEIEQVTLFEKRYEDVKESALRTLKSSSYLSNKGEG